MANRILIIVSIVAIILLLSLYPKPQKHKAYVDTTLFSNPIVLRMLHTYTHNIIADQLWLASNKVGELQTGSGLDNKEDFFNVFMTITFMDPYFYEPINYGAAYLVTMHEDLKNAFKIIDVAKYYDKKNFNLRFYEIIFYVDYDENNLDYDKLRGMLKEISLLPEAKHRMGIINIDNWIEDFLIYARKKENKQEMIKKDLLWLYKVTKNPSRKAEIEKRLQEFE